MTQELTRGRPAKLILQFSMPMLAGLMFQQLYSMADMVIVGRIIGMNALAAVGATGALSAMLLGFIQGLTIGLSVTAGQRFGANDPQGLRRSWAACNCIAAAVGLLLTVLTVAATPFLLKRMNTPEEILPDASAYISVIFLGTLAPTFFSLFSDVIRALGDSATPVIFLTVSSGLNILFDFLFILWFQMGTAGAAWATVLSQAISVVLCLVHIRKKFPVLRTERTDWNPEWKFYWQHLRLAIPMSFQFSVTSVGSVILQSVLNTFGASAVAAYTAAVRLENLAEQPVNAFGAFMGSYSAQNFGAGNYRRIREGLRTCTALSLTSAVICGVVIVFAGGPLVRLFLRDGQEQVIPQALLYLNVVAPFFGVLGLLFIFRNTLQGFGKSMVPFLAGIMELAVRIFVAFFLADALGYLGICLANPIAWVGAVLLLWGQYAVSMRKLLRGRHP